MLIVYHNRISINATITAFNEFLSLHLLKVNWKDMK